MLKSILLVVGGGLAIAALIVILGASPALAGSPQAAQSPAATATPAPATTPAPVQPPAQSGQTTPVLGESAAAAPAGAAMAANMKNPVKPTPESQAKAKQLYSIDCAMCHGDNGNGKTDLATSMNLTLADFTDPKALDGHMDGELFNVIRNGTADTKMPSEDKARASDNDVWNLVIYVRNFGKGGTQTAAAPAK